MIRQSDNYVVFSLGTELFGIRVEKVLEVLENANVSLVPEAPRFVTGVINFRGEIVPVISLNERFRIKPAAGLAGVIIILSLLIDNDTVLLGIQVDKVIGVEEFLLKNIKNAPESGLSFNPRFVEGMVNATNSAEIVLLINPDLLVLKEDLPEVEKNIEP